MFLPCCNCFPISVVESFINNDFFIPIFTSIVATCIVLLITEVISPYIKYSKLSGKFDIFWIKDWDKGGSEIDLNKPMGEVEIEYKWRNKLKIIHKQTMHDNYTQSINHQWEGTLIMETPQYGTVAFSYLVLWGNPLEMNVHRLGFKKVIYGGKKENKKIIYLIGDRAEGYGKEVLIEKK